MARKKPIVPLRRHYSRDLKRRVIYQSQVLGLKTTEIAINLDISVRVVQRIKQTWNEIGEVCRDRHVVRRAPLMKPEHCEFLLALLEHSPDIYLDEIQEQLEGQHNLMVSISTISNTLKRLGISSKKLSRIASERCDEARREFTLEIGQYPAEYLVFGDEAAVNLRTTYRTNGWSSRKLRARKHCCFIRGARYSILPAITVDGIIYSHIKEGSYNGDQFLQWLDDLLQIMNPYPAPHSVLVLDNYRIHHVEGVEEMCEDRGVKLVYLPPYSPELNPIEECFSFVKAYIRRTGQIFRDIAESGDKTEPFLYLYNAIELVPVSHCKAWFHDSGYL